ncbi:MAG TPA: hypothetical protein VHC70_11470 [Phycisphaerales bacterium]|jgi:hypothetical protein|nr:hypothetical protein [Phycisphaerales bacterium]
MRSQNNNPRGPSTSAKTAIDTAISRLRKDPQLVLRLFPSNWRDVDLARERAAAAGLADRLSIHHRLALGLLPRRVS